MKSNRLMIAVVGGMLAASSALAFPSGNQGHSCHWQFPPEATQTRTEVQVAVMAQSPSQPADAQANVKAQCPTVSEWYGTGMRTRATHSH
jgi:hypothetical protein